MRPFTTSTTTRPGASDTTRRARTRRHGALVALTATALTLAACGGSARSSMRPVIVEGEDRASGAVQTPTTRPTSVTGKIDTSTTVPPPRQPRSDAGGGAPAVDNSGAGVGDLEAPPTSAEPAAGGGGGGGGGTGGGGGSGLDGSDAVTTTASTEPPTTTAPPSTTTSLPPGAVAINVRQTAQYGPILVDGENHTLYASIADVNNEGTCHGACTAQWVPIAGNTVAPGEGISTSLIGAITRADTIVQLTYGGHPLYRLKNEPGGEVMGQGDAATWYVVHAQTGALVVS